MNRRGFITTVIAAAFVDHVQPEVETIMFRCASTDFPDDVCMASLDSITGQPRNDPTTWFPAIMTDQEYHKLMEEWPSGSFENFTQGD